jgi:hypothetical protein
MSETNEPIPYTTKDFAEAVTLATCGVPFFYPERRMMNVYRAGDLKSRGLSVAQAIERGIEGDKAWVFVRNADCVKVAAAFKAAWSREPDFKQVLPDFDIAQLAQVVATGLRNRKELANDWKHVTPHVAIDRGDGAVTLITPNTPKEVLERWGINS